MTKAMPIQMDGIPIGNTFIEDVTKCDMRSGKIIKFLAEGFSKKEIIDMVELNRAKTQAYAFIEKTQKLAKEIYDKTINNENVKKRTC